MFNREKPKDKSEEITKVEPPVLHVVEATVEDDSDVRYPCLSKEAVLALWAQFGKDKVRDLPNIAKLTAGQIRKALK